MLKGNLIAGHQEEVFNTSEYEDGSVRAYVTDTESDIIVGVYAYKNRIVVHTLTPDGDITELARVHTLERKITVSHDADRRY